MVKTLLAFTVLFFSALTSFGNFTTPGTGVKWNLDQLVTNAGGNISFAAGVYTVNDTITISNNDTLQITTDATVKFVANSYLLVQGALITNPPNNVLFTAQNTTTGYLGVRIENNNSSRLKKLTLEYAVSLRLNDCTITIDSCVFRYNNNSTSTAFGNGAIALFRANPVITNSKFQNNQRAAIQGGANIANAPKIINCLFEGNNTTNQNVPQINLGVSGTSADTVKIIGNQILRASTNSGAIGFLPVGGEVYTVIKGNTIKNNRYGITLNGGSNINAMIGYNVIDTNNTQGDPNLGGSGISLSGGSATSQQKTIITGNIIRGNLWGVTILGRSGPNLGNLNNTDTSDDGKNIFIGNNNANTPYTDVYNNTPDYIFAQGNYWASYQTIDVEGRIFHKVDDANLGLVNYTSFVASPANYTSFTATAGTNNVLLRWQTASEFLSSRFVVEKSLDGINFTALGTVNGHGTSTATNNYQFTDNAPSYNTAAYYRLKAIDVNELFSYSEVRRVFVQHAIVNLLRFTATPGSDNVALEWQTSGEFNCSRFILEKSLDNINFSPIATLPGGGTLLVARNYQYADRNVVYGREMYYRLKIVDGAENFEYSDTVSATLLNGNGRFVRVYPTVSANNQPLTAEVSSGEAQQITIRVFDNTGRLLGTQTKQLMVGFNRFQLTTGYLPRNWVYIQFTGKEIDYTTPVLKR